MGRLYGAINKELSFNAKSHLVNSNARHVLPIAVRCPVLFCGVDKLTYLGIKLRYHGDFVRKKEEFYN